MRFSIDRQPRGGSLTLAHPRANLHARLRRARAQPGRAARILAPVWSEATPGGFVSSENCTPEGVQGQFGPLHLSTQTTITLGNAAGITDSGTHCSPLVDFPWALLSRSNS